MVIHSEQGAHIPEGQLTFLFVRCWDFLQETLNNEKRILYLVELYFKTIFNGIL